MIQRALPVTSLLLFVLLLHSSYVSTTNKPPLGGDYFYSVVGLENLLKLELVIVADLEHYIDALQTHITALQSEVELIRKDHLTASKDVEGYLNNPVNAYRLIRRLHNGWNDIEELVRVDTSHKDFLVAMAMNRQNFTFPTKEDVDGSAAALVRLQDTYKLDVSELAAGILNGIKYGPSMSWQDCFTLGHHLYEMQDFNHTVSWFKQSVQLLKYESHHHHDALLWDFLETVSEYHQNMGDLDTALELLDYILAHDTTRLYLYTSKSNLEQMISNGVKTGPLYDVPAEHYHLTPEYKRYTQICRGDLALSATQQRTLRCKYNTNNVPYRLLQPFKLEELYLDPYIVQVHDVLDVRDINAIKRLAKGRMKRSMVFANDGSSEKITANYRISKTAWFNYETNQYTRRVLRHMADLSMLNMVNVEDLQVANYGIGGHYEPHYDFIEEDSLVPSDGNRIATAIFYLSDVEEGGGTAFTKLNLLVNPQKGSVLFWHNLYPSGDRDFRTKHAACPVLKGSKWIANIWVREHHQERNRPCHLKHENQI